MAQRSHKLFQVLGTIAAGVAIALVGAFFLDLFALSRDLGRAGWLVTGTLSFTNVTAIAACVLALVLVWRIPERSDVRALALFLIFLAYFWGSIFRFMSFEYDATARELNFSLSMGQGLVQLSYGALLLAIAAFLRFSALFPQLLTPEAITAGRGTRMGKAVRTWLARPTVAWAIPLVVIAILVLPRLGETPGTPQPGGIADVFAIWGLRGVLSLVFVMLVYALFPVLLIVLGTVNLWCGHRSSTGDERRRSNWVVTGFVTAAWMVLIPVVVNVVPDPGFLLFLDFTLALLFLAPAVLLVFLTIGIFNSGELDPGLVLRRSTVLGAFSGLAILGFSIAESIVSELLEARFGGIGDMVSAVLAGGLVALVLVPLRGRIVGGVRRWASRTTDEEVKAADG